MTEAIQFKILQRQLKFRNPNHLLTVPANLSWSRTEWTSAEDYVGSLYELGISWTYPGHSAYPNQFRKMKEPPLFLEYKGRPFWKDYLCLSIVGARKIHPLTKDWMMSEISPFLQKESICVVSGGAFGVDQWAHLISLKNNCPTIVVVPSGLVDMYPANLRSEIEKVNPAQVCFVSEFETKQPLRKSHFFFRNRLIAALGEMTLMTQADVKSGSLLTVHHALENGRPVLTLPAHPALLGFGGNLKLLQDGAGVVTNRLDLLQIWNGEIMASAITDVTR